MISNIVIACLREDVKQKTVKILADKMEMYYADIDELIKYDVNPQEVIEKVGVEYLQQLIDKQVYNISTYENTLITASDNILTNSKNILALKTSSLIILIKIPYSAYKKYVTKKCKGVIQPIDIINLNSFFDKEKIIEKSSNIVINAKWMNAKHIAKKVIKAIKKYYKNVGDN